VADKPVYKIQQKSPLKTIPDRNTVLNSNGKMM
jgi:hypothetical protein